MNVYSIAFEGLADNPVRILLTGDGRAVCEPGTFTLGPSSVDATGLSIAPDRLKGAIAVTCEPDAWNPPDRQTRIWRLDVDAAVNGVRIEGKTQHGNVTGEVREELPVPEICHWVITIEQAAPGWSGHLGRGELVVAGKEVRLRSPVSHSWVGRVEQADLTLSGGRVRALVGIQDGGTGAGGERVTYDLTMTRVGTVLSGVCIVTGQDGRPERRGLRGKTMAGNPVRPRPVVAATERSLAIDVRALRASKSVKPWRTVDVTPERFGIMARMADLDGDGLAEILTVNSDGLAIQGVLARRLDGTRLWQWGEMGTGRPPGDAPLQVGDLDGDGLDEVYVAARGDMVVLAASTGRELRRWPLPADLSGAECIVFGNFRGRASPGDVLVKDRYERCYAFTAAGESLWRWQDPAGRSIAHHPLVMDDGRVLVGWTMLRSDGRPCWELQSDGCDFRQGHLDSAAIIAGDRIAVCYDEANGLAVVDLDGKTCWEVTGSHFHTLCAGRFMPGSDDEQVLCMLARLQHWCWRAWLMDVQGHLNAEYVGLYLVGAVDWDGDGVQELVGGQGIVLRATGEPLVNLVDERGDVLPMTQNFFVYHLPDIVDVDGDGRGEVLLSNVRDTLRIYKPPGLAPRPGPHRIGKWNATAYAIPNERDLGEGPIPGGTRLQVDVVVLYDEGGYAKEALDAVEKDTVGVTL